MRVDVRWFFFGMLHQEYIDKDLCSELIKGLAADADLQTAAQAVVDVAFQSMGEADAQKFIEAVQQVAEFGAGKMAAGETPPDLSSFGVVERKIHIAKAVGAMPGGAPVARAVAVPAGVHAARPEAAAPAAPASPKFFSKPVSPGWEDIPSFEGVGKMDDKALKDFMLKLLRTIRDRGASDLHLSSLSNPFVRHCGVNKCISPHILSEDEALRLNTVMLNESDLKSFKEDNDLNYLLAIDKVNRFRVCLMLCKDGVAGAYRLVPAKIRSLPELGFSERQSDTVERFLDHHNGLVLITGPIGSGKTSTLAALVDIVNSKRHDHVITMEDPIEIVQGSKNCNVTQREIKSHTNSYKTALKGALREDPDVIVIGELHDLETIEMAITASETGHLVIGTLHTCDAANTLNRLLDVFPPSQQAQIRTMTAGSLRGIVCQKLLPTVDGNMTIAVEILVNNTATSNIISEGQTHMLRAVLQTGQKSGMCSMDASVMELFKGGRISAETALANLRFSDAKMELKRMAGLVADPAQAGKKR